MASFEVEKFMRGNDAKWFACGARRFRDETSARQYFADFVDDQRRVLGAGLRIDLRVRAGRTLIARAGGILGDDAARIREVGS